MAFDSEPWWEAVATRNPLGWARAGELKKEFLYPGPSPSAESSTENDAKFEKFRRGNKRKALLIGCAKFRKIA